MVKIVEHYITYKPISNIINITPTKSVSLEEIAKIVNRFCGNKVNIKIKNPIMNNEYTGDNSLLLSDIPDFEFTKIEDGLKKLYNYINQNN